MLLQINFKSGKPVYLQVVDQIKAAAASGTVQTGEPLPSIRPLAVQRQPPGHANQPRSESRAIAKLTKLAIRLRKRLLRHVLGILPLPQHAEGHTKRQQRRL